MQSKLSKGGRIIFTDPVVDSGLLLELKRQLGGLASVEILRAGMLQDTYCLVKK